jgi:hypothetical protein
VTPEEMEDLNLDEVFGNPENPVRVVQPEVPAQHQEVAQPSQPAEPFLKTRTGTVYKNAEDAANGIEHKDTLIAKLRQEAIERSGFDPLTGQPVVKAAEPIKSYAQDGKRFVEDLAKAAQTNDPNEYTRVQAQLINDVLAPYAPVLASLAKNQAVESVSARNPEIKNFLSSDDYKQTLTQFPLLRDAITASEGNPQAQSNLEQFYEMSFKLAAASKVPEVVRAEAQSTQRPTISSSTLPAVSSSAVSHTSMPSLNSPEGRRALIDQQERAGVMNIRM